MAELLPLLTFLCCKRCANRGQRISWHKKMQGQPVSPSILIDRFPGVGLPEDIPALLRVLRIFSQPGYPGVVKPMPLHLEDIAMGVPKPPNAIDVLAAKSFRRLNIDRLGGLSAGEGSQK